MWLEYSQWVESHILYFNPHADCELPAYLRLSGLALRTWGYSGCSIGNLHGSSIPQPDANLIDLWIYDKLSTQSLRLYMVLQWFNFLRSDLLLLLRKRDARSQRHREEITLHALINQGRRNRALKTKILYLSLCKELKFIVRMIPYIFTYLTHKKLTFNHKLF